jgi:protein TorT
VELLQVFYGDTGKAVQMKLIDDALQTYPDVNIVAGVAPAIEGAMEIVRTRGLENIELVSFYTTPATKQAVEEGRIAATVTDDSVMASRINVDQALRLLEGKDVLNTARSVFFAVDKDNAASFDWSRMLAPDGFEPAFDIE